MPRDFVFSMTGMKDEYKNECWYDFKNIQFLRTSDFFNTNSFLPHLEGDNYYYTFSDATRCYFRVR